jgi:AAA15 family ATPase/GTPase
VSSIIGNTVGIPFRFIDINKANILMKNIQNHFSEIERDDQGDLYSVYNIKDKTYKLPFKKESHGTQRLLRYANPIVRTLETGGIMIIDEIDSALHPEALQFVIRAFKDKNTNKKGAMLFYTCHNTSTIDYIDHENFFIVNKNQAGESKIYQPKDFEGFNEKRDKKRLKQDFETGYYGSNPITTSDLFGYEVTAL